MIYQNEYLNEISFPLGAQKTVFLVNPNEYGAQVQIEVDGTLWYVELRADSVATVELG